MRKLLLLIVPVLLLVLLACESQKAFQTSGELDCHVARVQYDPPNVIEAQIWCAFHTATPTPTVTPTPTPEPEPPQLSQADRLWSAQATPIPSTDGTSDSQTSTPECQDLHYGHRHIPPSYGKYSMGVLDSPANDHNHPGVGVVHTHLRGGDACDTYKIIPTPTSN